MADLTPRNLFPYPSEREEPFFSTAKSGYLAEDAVHWANSENGNLTYIGGGFFNWDASLNLLWWTESIYVSGFTTPWKAIITGPASVQIQEGEVVFYQMPRLIQFADVTVPTLYRSSRIFLEGVRLNDLRLLCYRTGDTLFFANGKSLKDGETGPLFGSGIGAIPTAYIPHRHATAVLIVPPVGTTLLIPTPVYTAPELVRFDVFKNGQLLTEGIDYAPNLLTGEITLTVPSVLADKFVVWRELRDFPSSFTTHDHLPKLILTPVIGTTVLNALVAAPVLQRVDVFRNGQLLVEGGAHDYTVDLSTGLITLSVASILADKFEIHRQIAV